MSSAMRSDERSDLISVVSCGWTCAWGGDSACHSGAACFAHGKALDDIKNRGNKEDAQSAGCEHAADHGGAHDLTCDRPCTAGGPERDTAKDEGEGSHQDGAKAQAGAFESGIDERLALFILILGKFDDEDGVFGRETDEHDQADLRVHVVFDLHHVRREKFGEQSAPQPENEEST